MARWPLLERWFSARLPGAGSLLVPADDPFARALRVGVVTCFGVLVVSGVVLMTAYAPSPASAWASVHYIEFVQPAGWLVRGLHANAAQAMLVLAAVDIGYGALRGAYRPPRELDWWATLAVIGLVVAQGILGGLLPWDQRGWWARQVEGHIVGLAPVIGGWIAAMFFGGPELGALGLTRAYALHVVVMTGALGALLAVRAWLTPRARGAAASSILFAAIATLVLVALAVALRPTPLDAPADPMSDYPARPEWFLLPLYELRKFFHGPWEFWGTTVVPGLAVVVLAALPWVDPNGRARTLVWALVGVVLAAPVGLALAAHRHDAADSQYAKARAEADARAAAATRLAMGGVPPEGALAMIRRDPELRGHDLFEKHCASCHVLAGLGDPKKATATRLDGWGTSRWIADMIHAPDAPEFFGRTPYAGEMPSVDERPRDPRAAQGWTATVKNDRERVAVARFLASLGESPSDIPPSPPADPATLAAGEKIVSERCTTCHLYKGEGDDQGTGLAPELAGYGSEAWTRAQVANPASTATYREKALDPALKKHMPRFDKELSEADLTIVARWTRAHARGVALSH